MALLSLPAGAQAPMPVAEVQAQALAAPGGVAVIELFSSQACVFCPQADRLFSDLVQQDNVIGLACHVDYFDVREGSLAKPFCTERQSWYVERLHAGPNYTPQMVVQGVEDVVAYRREDVIAAVQRGMQQGLPTLSVAPAGEKDKYEVALPDGFVAQQEHLYLALIDKPRDLTVSEGRNKDQKIVYYNIVSEFTDLGSWPEGQGRIIVNPALTAGNKGFVVLLQDADSAKMTAAGQYVIN